jgi:uncharacterized protein DUF4157
VDPGEPVWAPPERRPGRATPLRDTAPSRPADLPGAVHRLASAAGNRHLGRALARWRAGEGITSGGVVHPDVEAAISASRGGGRPLDRGTAQRLGDALGDLSDVRVHTDSRAGELARAVDARAFTVGRDVFFAEGEYRPGTRSGDDLLAHELTHVVQQRGAPPSGPLTVTEPGDAMEREADDVARSLGA